MRGHYCSFGRCELFLALCLLLHGFVCAMLSTLSVCPCRFFYAIRPCWYPSCSSRARIAIADSKLSIARTRHGRSVRERKTARQKSNTCGYYFFYVILNVDTGVDIRACRLQFTPLDPWGRGWGAGAGPATVGLHATGAFRTRVQKNLKGIRGLRGGGVLSFN